ncbi:hypothetical protein Q765_01660 [Flavobacterium rivuli WB 3.3-2 = DSM 21788]|uniref:NACHT domain-containing protein n=1 Tax=Flavobacterium rivuli WB 3.3-2 = DSM 21788 TaxID=1121895 RepID=A0A0A2M8Q4_9FLAO|nr:NACHT domain-containing protein [Flavobacterium rivuli]KGO88634.1 hypothetical protein Q765_01660 [Flavobacterium rivuli WB 3.3-2 = DSM 21788]
MALETILKLLTVFKEPLFAATNGVKEEFIQAFNNGLIEFLENYYDKYSNTKTFIYRDEKADFYDIYYPVTLKNRGKSIFKITDLKHLFNNNDYITIIGTAGSGKSMLMKHIFLSTINQSYKIPIVLELRNLNDYDGSLFDYISESLLSNKLVKSKNFIERILSKGNFLFLFDGYDEIYSSNKNKTTNEIENFVDLYNKNIFVITSRPGANCESLQRFNNFYVEPLTDQQIKDFITQQYKYQDDKESIEKVVAVIENPLNRDYKDYLTNPLLLSMFIFTFNNYPELPRSKNKFYWNVFDTLCTKHDTFTKKGSWLHERKSGLLNEDFENILKWFSYITLFKGRYNFDEKYLKTNFSEIIKKLDLKINLEDLIYDLNVSISILILDGTDYTFPHKSLQEYFCALLIKELNENQKEKIYTEKFANLSHNSTGGNLNFFKLCYELDKSSFLKYYLIPQAKNFLSKIDNSTTEKLIKSFIREFGFTIEFQESKNNKWSIKMMTYSQVGSESFLSFFKTQKSIPDIINLNRAENIKLIENYLNKKSIKILILSNAWNREIRSFVKATGIDTHFKNLFVGISEGIERLEEESKRDKTIISELLDI